jgi:hypothetical protein
MQNSSHPCNPCNPWSIPLLGALPLRAIRGLEFRKAARRPEAWQRGGFGRLQPVDFEVGELRKWLILRGVRIIRIILN